MTQQVCRTCKGTGNCPSCGGRGVIVAPRADDHGPEPANLCASCFGSGKCRDCKAAKTAVKKA
jgi:DnaJ-class molecular chaperone